MRLGGLIETSASLQPGDSGGPLFDTSGRVVGMDAAASNGTTAAYDSLVDSYAIPIDRVRRIVHQIDAGRSSATVHIGRTAFLGVQVASPGAAGAGSRGAVVGGIVPGSPVARTPLGFGDTIVALGGRPVRNSSDLVGALLRHHPGDHVTVKWLDGERAHPSHERDARRGPAAVARPRGSPAPSDLSQNRSHRGGVGVRRDNAGGAE